MAAADSARLAPQFLEQWYRDHLDPQVLDISSSGVYPYALTEILELSGMDGQELLGLVLDDSTALGAERLRRAVADRLRLPDHHLVMATHGSSEALDLGLRAILRPGDEVVIVHPAYHALASVPQMLGCRITWWRLNSDDGFRVDLDKLRSLVGPGTRALIVNFPHNPTGLTLTRQEFDELIRLVDATGTYLVWDGAFTDLVYDDPALPEPATCTDRVLSTGTLSKAFGAPGLRCGWLAAPEDVMATCVALRDRGNLFLSPIVETVTAAVLEHADVVVGTRLAEAARNRDRMRDFLSAAPWVRRFTGTAGVTFFAEHATESDTTQWCRTLAAAGVVLVPGVAFGEPGWIRMGFGGPSGQLDAALRELDRIT